MAKIIVQDTKTDMQSKGVSQAQGNPPDASLKSKDASARDYLNTFYPGWDVYLKNKR